MTTLHEYLYQLRTARGWSLDDLSDQCGISKSSLWRFEQASSDVHVSTLDAIAQVYGLRAGDVLITCGYTSDPVPAQEVRRVTLIIHPNGFIGLAQEE